MAVAAFLRFRVSSSTIMHDPTLLVSNAIETGSRNYVARAPQNIHPQNRQTYVSCFSLSKESASGRQQDECAARGRLVAPPSLAEVQRMAFRSNSGTSTGHHRVTKGGREPQLSQWRQQ
eukprot:2360171-Amphidinium_carterae.1